MTAIAEYNQKLFTAVPADKIVIAHRSGQSPGYFFQDSVAGEVTMCVIDSLEVVDIAKQN